MHQPPLQPQQGFLALGLAPTPEKARKIQRDLGEFESRTNVRTTCFCSGNPTDRPLRDLRRGFEICIATPGRIYAFLEEGQLDIGWCKYFVLDEADRMVDMGFEQQVLAISKYIRPDRQTLIWISRRPRELYRLADALLKNYIEVNVSKCRKSPDQTSSSWSLSVLRSRKRRVSWLS
ncbi:hypothetical protein HPB49_009131 [Dermacentor silvarum]|uniref:Uncharacterized protein n=1 Tax=Dermacentor silvarum TaxID=543639 RepID=A0ACB8DYL4_DERSI|nr:hypothetical protein HPB49_009131 [Dermacentor silvarum]